LPSVSQRAGIAYRSTTVTRSERSSSRPAAVLIWFVAAYAAPEAFPDLSHTVVTLPFVEIEAVRCDPLSEGTTQVLSVIVSAAAQPCHPVEAIIQIGVTRRQVNHV
jgi:hypothetical protein